MLHLALSLSHTWLRGDAWRTVDSRVEGHLNGDAAAEATRLAEAAALDFVLRPDALWVDPEVIGRWPGFTMLDPTVLLASLARETRRIGLVTTTATTFSDPFHTARQVQSLNSISAGRAGWNVVTSLGGAQNFTTAEMPDSPSRYRRAEEFVDVVRSLWASYPARAVIADRTSGVYADVTAVRPVDHRGEHFTVAGPLTVPGPDTVPILQAGGSPAGRELAARTADAIFAMAADVENATEQRTDLATRARAHGRRAPRLLPGLALLLAGTAELAHEREAELRATQPSGPGARHWRVVGTSGDAVEAISAWAEAGAIDGVVALPATWESLERFCGEVAPALAARGLAPDRYASTTLAGHLGLGSR